MTDPAALVLAARRELARYPALLEALVAGLVQSLTPTRGGSDG
jgi:phosphoglycerate dehydrogenase-like enzyme